MVSYKAARSNHRSTSTTNVVEKVKITDDLSVGQVFCVVGIKNRPEYSRDGALRAVFKQ